MLKKTIHIKGMHCRSCEILLEDELKRVPGVKHVDISFHTGLAKLSCAYNPNDQSLNAAVTKAGYSISVEHDPIRFLSSKPQDYVDLGYAVAISAGLFFIAKALGLFNLGSSLVGNYNNLTIVFLVGLTAGVSTCMALVGGLVLGAAAKFSADNPQATNFQKFKPHLLFNVGRVISYFVLGGAMGALGSLFQLSSAMLGTLTIIVGLVMLVLGGQLIAIFPFLKKLSFTLPKSLSRLFGIQTQTDPFVLGALTFFLPCGFTQSMQLYAISTGNVLAGAVAMGVFALGTVPGLLSIGGLASFVKGKIASLFFKTAGMVVIGLALFNLFNGLNLLGLTPIITKPQAVPNVEIQDGVQIIRMTQEAGGYVPNSFIVKKDIPVRWIITSKTAYSCAASIIVPELGIRRNLEIGENIIEFTPNKLGTLRFSCSMGMYTGSFTVN